MVARPPPLGFILSLGTLLILTACDNRVGELATGISAGPAANEIPTNNTSTLEVRIERPSNGATVSGTVAIEVRTKEKDVRRARTDLFIGDALVTSNTAERFTYSWSTTGHSGSRTITAVGWDVQGNSALASITVTVAGGSTEPPPPTTPTPTSVTLDPATVVAGETSTGTVVLSAAAPAGGTEVAVTSNNTKAATVPPSITVPEGETTGTFTVTTHPVASGTGLAISVNSGGTTRTASLWVNPAGVTLDSLRIDRKSMTSGETAVGSVELTGAAPEGGALVTLSSSDETRATVPPSVTVPAGETVATFTVTAQPVTPETAGAAYISAVYGGVTRTVMMNIDPPGPGEGELTSLTINPNLVVGGETSQGTVTLGAATGSDTQVTLTSTDLSVATVPSSVTVPAGATSATFTITTLPNNTGVGQSSWISGEAGGVTRGAGITTTGAPSGPALSSLTFSPANVTGGGASTGTITLDGPATDGAMITLTSSHPDIVQVPAEKVVSANQSSATFSVTTAAVTSVTAVTITATAKSGATGTRTATLTVSPGDPPPADVVRIEKAELKKCILYVKATTTNNSAILTVNLTNSGGFLMTLTHIGNGIHEGERAYRPPGTNVPVGITVNSNFGGSASTTVSDPQAGRCRADR